MSDDVIDIKRRKKKDTEEFNFEEIMKRNAKNKERQEQDRKKDNKNTKRSYRLRGKDD